MQLKVYEVRLRSHSSTVADTYVGVYSGEEQDIFNFVQAQVPDQAVLMSSRLVVHVSPERLQALIEAQQAMRSVEETLAEIKSGEWRGQ